MLPGRDGEMNIDLLKKNQLKNMVREVKMMDSGKVGRSWFCPSVKWLALLMSLTMLSCAGLFEEDTTGLEEETPTEKEENRFAFLRRDEQETHIETEESIEHELVKSELKIPESVTDEKLKDLTTSQQAPLGGESSEARRAGAVSEGNYYDDFIVLDGDEELPVSLIFNNAPLLDVLSAFADVLGFNFVADSDLKSTVTLNLNSTMTRKELWTTFDRMVYIAGGTVRREGALLRIFARAKLPGQPGLVSGNDKEAEIIYYPLRTATAREAVSQIRPFLNSGGICIELTKPNAVLVCDVADNIPKLRMLLECLDANSRENWPRAVIRCNNVLPSKVVAELVEVLPVIGFKVVKTTDRAELPGSVQLVGLDRLQVLVVSAATDEGISAIREWVELLDTRDIDDQERIFVYKVRHNKASYLTQALAVLYDTYGSSIVLDPDTGKSRVETISTNSRLRVTNNTANTAAARTNRTVAANAAANTETDPESNLFTNTVRVYADGVLNRLVIRTTPRTYASIKALLDRLDVVPAQVLLQVLVVEVTLSETTQFGLEFSGSTDGSNANTLFGTNYSGTSLNPFATDSEGNTTILTGSDRQDGGTFFINDPDNPQKRFGYIRALAGNGTVKIISSPQLLVSSHTEASINVGSDVPVITSGYTSTQSSGTTQYNYDYKPTGVTLTVTPQITSTDLITMEIKQELSQAIQNTTSTIQTPEITQRVIETSMTIANGQTMIIGGLIQEKKKDSLDSLPFINHIPLLNRLVGSTDASVERSEILMMITGYIINEHSPVEEMIKRYNDAIEALNDFDSKLGDRPGASESHPALMTTKEFWL